MFVLRTTSAEAKSAVIWKWFIFFAIHTCTKRRVVNVQLLYYNYYVIVVVDDGDKYDTRNNYIDDDNTNMSMMILSCIFITNVY